MPPPKKLDLVPSDLKKTLREALKDRGYGDIIEVTRELNSWLADEGIGLTIGKTAVGKYAQLLKDQSEALEIAEELMSEMGIEAEASMHKAIMQMIAAQAVQLMMNTREAGGHLEAKDLMNLGRMLKDVMSSAGIREKIVSDERERIEKETRERTAGEAEQAARQMGFDDDQAARLRRKLLGIAP